MSLLYSEPRRSGAPALSRVPARRGPVQALLRTFAGWQARNEARAKLRRMPDYLLRDIGLDTADVLKETRKPFWTP